MLILSVIAMIAGVIGIVGSIVPGLPGPPIGWVGMLLAFIAKGTNASSEPMTMGILILWALITVVVSVLDYVVPAKFTRMAGGSKAASKGAIIGLFAGMFIPPVGIILGSILGAFIAELIFAGKNTTESLKSSLGAFAGFIFGTGLKLITSGVMMYYILVYSF